MRPTQGGAVFNHRVHAMREIAFAGLRRPARPNAEALAMAVRVERRAPLWAKGPKYRSPSFLRSRVRVKLRPGFVARFTRTSRNRLSSRKLILYFGRNSS